MKKTIQIVVLLLLIACVPYLLNSLLDSEAKKPLNLLTGLVGFVILIVLFLLSIFSDLIKDEFKKTEPGEKVLEFIRRVLSKWQSTEASYDLNKILNNLKEGVIKASRRHIGAIEADEIKLIKNLHWRKKGLLYTEQNKSYMHQQGSLKEILERSGKDDKRSIMVLGGPGVGKTSAIHNFILNTANDAGDERVVVYFSLSLWTKDQSIDDWICDEFEKNYSFVPKPARRELIRKNKIFPIFDGLDQVNNDLRNKCAEQLLKYSSRNQSIITCRPEAFEGLKSYFKEKEISLEIAFSVYELMPLSLSTVREVLTRIDGCTHILEIFNKSSKFRYLLRYPLALYLVVKSRKSISLAEVLHYDKQGEKFDEFSKSMFNKLWQKHEEKAFAPAEADNHRQKTLNTVSYPEAESRFWLRRIARGAGDTVFIADIQPRYLNRAGDLILYYYFSRIFAAVLLSMATGFFLAGPLNFLGAGIVAGIIVATVTLIVRRVEIWQGPQGPVPGSTGTSATSWVRFPVFVLLYGATVLTGLTLYLGFSTLREPEDMRLNGTFAITEANIGLFITLFMGILFGLRESWYAGNDIKPVEKPEWNWGQFMRFGVIGGIALGLILTVAVVMHIKYFEDSSFNDWVKAAPYNVDISVLAMLAGMAFGFPLIGLLGLLKQNYQDTEKKQQREQKIQPGIKPDYGLRRTIKYLLQGSALVSLVMTVILGVFFGLLTRQPTCLLKGMMAGLGVGMMAGLWFGGFELVYHFTLRGIISLRKLGPWHLVDFLDFSCRMRFLVPTGAGYQFVHDTLYQYLLNTDRSPVPAPQSRPVLITTLVLLMLVAPLLLVIHRFSANHLWRSPVGFHFAKVPAGLQRLDEPDKLLVHNSGTLRIAVDGRIYVGGFAGYAQAEGTEAGFIGFNIGDTYDQQRFKQFQHAALVIRRSQGDRDTLFTFAGGNAFLFPWKARVTTLRIYKGDTLQFFVNDKEWQNNFGRYNIDMAYYKANRK